MKKILVVDDSKDIRDLVIATLDMTEYKVFEAGDAVKAIAVATVEKPDIIIMDVMLPGNINGLEATNIIKSNPTTSHCDVIILTGTNEKRIQRDAIKAGATCYFIKPFSPLDLLQKVEEIALSRTSSH